MKRKFAKNAGLWNNGKKQFFLLFLRKIRRQTGISFTKQARTYIIKISKKNAKKDVINNEGI